MRRFPLITGILGIGSFVGLLQCRQFGATALFGGGPFNQTTAGRTVVLVLSCIWLITLFILVPLQVVLRRSRVRETRKQWTEGKINPKGMDPIRRAVFLANFGSLPKWLYMPFVVIAIILGTLFALGFALVFVVYILTQFFRP